jgi:hypothetical protein
LCATFGYKIGPQNPINQEESEVNPQEHLPQNPLEFSFGTFLAVLACSILTLLALFNSSPDRDSDLNSLGTQEAAPSPAPTSVASGLMPLEEPLAPKKKLLSAFDAATSSVLPPNPPRKKMCLPSKVSDLKKKLPVQRDKLRCSSRLQAHNEGFKHSSLEDTPKKRARGQMKRV